MMSTSLEAPELPKLKAWANEVLGIPDNDSSSERDRILHFLKRLRLKEDSTGEVHWHAFQLMRNLEKNSISLARSDSAYATFVNSLVSELNQDLFAIPPAERKARYKLLALISSRDNLLSKRLERLKPFLSVDPKELGITQEEVSIIQQLCQFALASPFDRRLQWEGLSSMASANTEGWSRAAAALQVQAPLVANQIEEYLDYLKSPQKFQSKLRISENKFVLWSWMSLRRPIELATTRFSLVFVGLLVAIFSSLILANVTGKKDRTNPYVFPSKRPTPAVSLDLVESVGSMSDREKKLLAQKIRERFPNGLNSLSSEEKFDAMLMFFEVKKEAAEEMRQKSESLQAPTPKNRGTKP